MVNKNKNNSSNSLVFGIWLQTKIRRIKLNSFLIGNPCQARTFHSRLEANLGTNLNDVAEVVKPGQTLPVEGEEQEVGRDGQERDDLGGERGGKELGDRVLLPRDRVELQRGQDHVGQEKQQVDFQQVLRTKTNITTAYSLQRNSPQVQAFKTRPLSTTTILAHQLDLDGHRTELIYQLAGSLT